MTDLEKVELAVRRTVDALANLSVTRSVLGVKQHSLALRDVLNYLALQLSTHKDTELDLVAVERERCASLAERFLQSPEEGEVYIARKIADLIRNSDKAE